MIELPAGTLSDDTQLRLATARCIRSSGRFDAEAFSKIELPVFLSYGLGVGRGTKAAAQSLGRRDTRWYSNFYNGGEQHYVNGGGNGAAMRIQPHVWAASKGRADVFLAPLLQDTISTHGHLKGILGAVLHAVALWTTLKEREIPRPDRWLGMVDFLEVVDEMIRADETLGARWLPRWEQETGATFATELERELRELSDLVRTATKLTNDASDDPRQDYARLADRLGGLSPATRGAGTISAVLALWLASTHRDRPAKAVEMSAGCLGTDTDTVATMVGVLVGAVSPTDPPQLPMDAELIRSDAHRLERLSEGEKLSSFKHPDTLHWHPPTTLSDALGTLDGRTAIAGLGFIVEEGEKFNGQGKNAGIWQWVHADFGQTFLIKRRDTLPELPQAAAPRHRPAPNLHADPRSAAEGMNRNERAHLHDRDLPLDPALGLEILVRRKMDARVLADLALHYAEQGTVSASTFAIMLAEHLQARKAGGSYNRSDGSERRRLDDRPEMPSQPEQPKLIDVEPNGPQQASLLPPEESLIEP